MFISSTFFVDCLLIHVHMWSCTDMYKDMYTEKILFKRHLYAPADLKMALLNLSLLVTFVFTDSLSTLKS